MNSIDDQIPSEAAAIAIAIAIAVAIRPVEHARLRLYHLLFSFLFFLFENMIIRMLFGLWLCCFIQQVDRREQARRYNEQHRPRWTHRSGSFWIFMLQPKAWSVVESAWIWQHEQLRTWIARGRSKSCT